MGENTIEDSTHNGQDAGNPAWRSVENAEERPERKRGTQTWDELRLQKQSANERTGWIRREQHALFRPSFVIHSWVAGSGSPSPTPPSNKVSKV
jgi:hypothetical protein